MSPSRAARTAGPLLCALLGGACSFGGSADSDAFEEKSTEHATLASYPFAVEGQWLVYLADEAGTGPGGTDLNGDGDRVDAVAFAVEIDPADTFPIGAAARDLVIVQDEIYLEVHEAEDGMDWNDDGDQEDLVLLHWSEKAEETTFVDTLRTGPSGPVIRRVDGRLYYATAGDPSDPDGTTVRFLREDEPTLPVEVLAEPGAGPLRPYLLGARQSLIFLGLDETVDGLDRNGDGDADDRAVLALLNGERITSLVKSTGLALAAGDPAFAVRRDPDAEEDDLDEWLVGFLVSEADQGAVNLNAPGLFDPAWEPPQCAGSPDGDAADEVLHFLNFAAWFDGLEDPVNTGLAGRDRVVVVEGFLGTLSPEDEAGCDLNGDFDLEDTVVRWVEATTPVLPAVLADELLAVAAVPGGARGFTDLDERFMLAVDEEADSRDHNEDGLLTFDLLAWLDPAESEGWTFLHEDPDDFEVYVGVEWMTRNEASGRLAVSYLEAVQGLNLNNACSFDSADQDQDDALPASEVR